MEVSDKRGWLWRGDLMSVAFASFPWGHQVSTVLSRFGPYLLGGKSLFISVSD